MFLSRRNFLQTLGAGAAALALTAPRIPAFATPGGAEAAIKIIDSARELTDQASLIRAAGIATVIRYYSRDGGRWPVPPRTRGQWEGKVMSASELKALQDAGLSVAVVFQFNNDLPQNFEDDQKKIIDADWALRHAEDLGQPTGTPIYFGIDFNLMPVHEKSVRAYFEHIASALASKGYEVGIYGCGATCELVGDVAKYFWLSASIGYQRTSEFYNSGNWHLFQNKIELLKPYASQRPTEKRHRVIDTNILNDRFEYFGQWRTDQVPVAHPKAQSAALLANRGFVTAAPDAVVFNQESGSWEPGGKPIPYARNVKFLGRRGEYLAISFDEGDELLGYCRASDLSCNLSKMPPYHDKNRGAELACK